VFGDNHRLEKKLRESGGVCAEATILKKREGAVVENQNWKGERNMSANWHLTVHVQAPGGEPFQTSFVQRIGAGATGLLQNGMVQSIPVIFDPSDHKKIALDQVVWGERLRAQSWGGATAVNTPAAAAPAAGDQLQALSRLADLRDRGVLTDEEFEAQKAKLLGS
jgi:Short C-terminal domain